MNDKKILVVEDDKDLISLIKFNLKSEGFNVLLSPNGEDGLFTAKEEKPDLILLDWMLPILSGIEVLQRLKNNKDTKSIPVIFITAKGEENDKIRGLNSGADDYIVKPFSTKELIARIKANLRRGKLIPDDKIVCSDIEIDLVSKRVKRQNKIIHLGPIEFRLLHYLCKNQGRVFSRDQLLDNVWGNDVYVEQRTVDVHIRRLRKALNINNLPNIIRTIRSEGYSVEST
ncbi:MAG: DNA-binding response regulator [Alphaproteobacteria bacterium]|jgi:two-component system phosphate regulon response regulator PhoB|nr:MAG: DNA-binding response regulator [Alphaproteobacteria bacterium]|tara:strand:- start:36 stop:722 length:687 start_codon:yes stop_codon:yes gene_type:complete